MLIWSRSARSWEDWADENPALLALFRQLLECAEGWVHYWVMVQSFCVPWLWAGVIDHRRPDRIELGAQLWNLAEELTDEWFHQEIMSRLNSVAEIFEKEFQAVITLWTWLVFGTCCQAEYMHRPAVLEAWRQHHLPPRVAQPTSSSSA